MKELEKTHLVSRSKFINHSNYSEPILMVQYGWADKYKTVWDKDFKLLQSEVRNEHK